MDISFILVRPAVPENIGAAARAIKTMGFSKLILVDTSAHLCPKAQWLAHSSQDILEQASYFNEFADAILGFDLIIGTSAKKRSVRQDYIAIDMLPQFIASKAPSNTKIAIVFGCEESGLTNEQLDACHVLSHVPLATVNPSLNLSQAVMLYAYQLASLKNMPASPAPSSDDDTVAFGMLKEKVKKLLYVIGYAEQPAFMGRIMERIAFLSPKDAGMVHSVCNKILDKLKA